jgi:hypothetical protein
MVAESTSSFVDIDTITSTIASSPSLRDFLAGTMGGFAGKLLDYPLDTVKGTYTGQPIEEFCNVEIGLD